MFAVLVTRTTGGSRTSRRTVTAIFRAQYHGSELLRLIPSVKLLPAPKPFPKKPLYEGRLSTVVSDRVIVCEPQGAGLLTILTFDNRYGECEVASGPAGVVEGGGDLPRVADIFAKGSRYFPAREEGGG